MNQGPALILNKNGEATRASKEQTAVSLNEQQNYDSKYKKQASFSRNSTEGIPLRSSTGKEDTNQSIGALIMNRRALSKRGVIMANTRDALKSQGVDSS